MTHDGSGDHGHGHGHGHGHPADPPGVVARLRDAVAHLFAGHSHDPLGMSDDASATREGTRALLISFGVLGVTAALQAILVVVTHSAALLGDCLHNIADALTVVPLGVAFIVGRRPSTRRYTYGFGRAEDLAGIAIVLTIAGSAAVALLISLHRLVDPHPVTHLGALSAAAVIGFLGNEWVARYRITVGRRIGSAALVADGLHARTDGFTSLAVLIGAGGVALGWQRADPIVGLVIAAAIVAVLREAAREIYRRLMDAIDPVLLDRAEDALRNVPGVAGIGEVRMRWIGHSLRAEAEVTVDPALTIVAAHQIAVEAEHALLHAIPRLAAVTVHPDPSTAAGGTHHARSHHHGRQT